MKVTVPEHDRILDLPDSDIPMATRLWCIMAAIERVQAARNTWRDVEVNAGSTGADREKAALRLAFIEMEFSWQWKNVEAILASPDVSAAIAAWREPEAA